MKEKGTMTETDKIENAYPKRGSSNLNQMNKKHNHKKPELVRKRTGHENSLMFFRDVHSLSLHSKAEPFEA